MSLIDKSIQRIREYLRTREIPIYYTSPYLEPLTISPGNWFGVFVVDVSDGLLGQLLAINEVTSMDGTTWLDLHLGWINLDAVLEDNSVIPVIAHGFPVPSGIQALNDEKVLRRVRYFVYWHYRDPKQQAPYRVRKDLVINFDDVNRGKSNVLITDRYAVTVKLGVKPPHDFMRYIQHLENELAKYRILVHDVSLRLMHAHYVITSFRDAYSRVTSLIQKLVSELDSVRQEALNLYHELETVKAEARRREIEVLSLERERVATMYTLSTIYDRLDRFFKDFLTRSEFMYEDLERINYEIQNLRRVVEEMRTAFTGRVSPTTPTPISPPETKPVEVKPEVKPVEVATSPSTPTPTSILHNTQRRGDQFWRIEQM